MDKYDFSRGLKLPLLPKDVDSDYEKYPCLCSHMESSHLRVTGKCRVKQCQCHEFVNAQYITWRVAAIQADVKSLQSFLRRAIQRLEGGDLRD